MLVKSIISLVSSNLATQIITFAALPILTRLYQPSDFGILAFLSAIILMATSISTLRFEIPIPNVKSSVEATYLIFAAVLNATLATLLVALLITIERFNELFNQISESNYILAFLIPFGIWWSCTFNIMQFYAIRERQYILISKVRLQQSLIGIGIQIIFGFFESGAIGLLVGFLMQIGLGSIVFIKHLAKNSEYWIESIKLKSIKKIYIKHVNYFKYSTPEAFFHMASLQLPFVIISYFVSAQEAGMIFMANRIMQLPVSLIAGSIAQIFTGELPEKIRIKELNSFFRKTIKNLLIFAVVPTFFLGILLYFSLAFILGEEWQRAGLMALIMVPFISIQIIASATGSILYATDNERSAFKIHFYGFWIRIVLLTPVCIYYPDFAFIMYVLGGLIHYTLYLRGINSACRMNKM